ncbi:ABC transporter permease [Actinomadura algeriensis]|uniref:ABC-2 type transport system permease protein n=1 Tax=Actinomadura algeriensis TaxID=1679523 RepID=A0ABR9JVV8_9ACTN|nr:ABC transporter permease [Actinomadura algeriensis]MBE1534613.1 ABC-2 type transport system permease protein [Actinomadura algeriensis]
MNARVTMIGLRRGGAEYMHFLRNRQEFVSSLIGTVGVYAALVLWQGGHDVKGAAGASQAVLMTAGFIAFSVYTAGLMGLPMSIAADREEGTLLRMRTIPNGVPAYLIGRAVYVLAQIGTYVALMLVAGAAFGGLDLPAAGDWLTLAWVLVLGTLSVVPLGAALGALLPGSRNAAGILSLPMMGLMLVSGVMFPVTAMPEPVQWVAQAFPLYWQGLGLRSVFLPDAMLAAEIGGSWRLAEAAAVLGAWSLLGLLLAPVLLRRAARRESGTRLARAQERRAAQGAL